MLQNIKKILLLTKIRLLYKTNIQYISANLDSVIKDNSLA